MPRIKSMELPPKEAPQAEFNHRRGHFVVHHAKKFPHCQVITLTKCMGQQRWRRHSFIVPWTPISVSYLGGNISLEEMREYICWLAICPCS